MKRILCLLLCLWLPLAGVAEELPVYDYDWHGTSIVSSYDSNSLIFTIEKGKIGETLCYFTKIWMKNPGKQIRKATAPWEQSLEFPDVIASQIPEAALAVNGSGFVSPQFPEIPDSYPGESADYYYTPLGSLTITDGLIYRHLEGIPFYGLTLQTDGLHLHTGEDIEEILENAPTQTWSFYEGCPLIKDHESLLDESWYFAIMKAVRNIIFKMDDHNYVIITATSTMGLSLVDAVDFIQEHFDPEWAYNLDGGSSAALMAKSNRKKKLEVVYGNHVRVTDIMAFCELTETE